MHNHSRRVSTMMGTVAGFMLLAFVSSVALSQAADPTAPSPSQEKAVEKGDPGQVQERTVSLTQAVHFTDAKGQDVVVGPGSYRVEAEGTNRIRLVPAETGGTVVIEATSLTHQHTVESPVPVTVPDPQQPDVLHLALLLPGGQGVGAIGTYSGVKPRGVTNTAIWMQLAPRYYGRAGVLAPKTGGMTVQGNQLTAMPGYVLEMGPNNQVMMKPAGGGLGITRLICGCSKEGHCTTLVIQGVATCGGVDGDTCTGVCAFSSISTGNSGGILRQ